VFDRLCAAVEMFEADTLLGALAERTSSVRLLALVSPVTMRAPGLLAKAVTTVDVLSRGRAVLGIGAGWDVAEAEAYGIGFLPTGERTDRLDEALQICRALFSQQHASVSGAHYGISDARNSPRPVGPTIPVLVGGGHPGRRGGVRECTLGYCSMTHPVRDRALWPC
jgi:alkanesulfonate monooxygenase SsuD/methylene tetrahydromethanopterin reductase-like flavin-dependent oxidoreductase (luciferase family)